MKINKNIIKELNDYLDEFNLTEIEYTEKDVKVKVSKSLSNKNLETSVPNFTKEAKKDEVLVDNSKKISSPAIFLSSLAQAPKSKSWHLLEQNGLCSFFGEYSESLPHSGHLTILFMKIRIFYAALELYFQDSG